MAETTVSSTNVVTQWSKKFFSEYIRGNRFIRYMGDDEDSVIQLVEDLTKKAGETVNVSFIAKLSNTGVTGSTTLVGNEEALSNYGHKLTVAFLRNAVRVDESEMQKSEIDLLNAGKKALMNWAKEKIRDDIITAMGMFNTGTGNGTAYASASEATKDAHLANNSDRFLFGAALSNNAANDHSAALANVDNTSDKFTAARVGLMKRIAKTASPLIRPIRVREDEEWYVIFTGSRAFRDLKTDLLTVHEYAADRGKNNPIFVDGDLIYDGCVIREIPEIGVITGVGNGGIDVQPAYLCGAQAVAVAWAQRTKATTEDFDYDFKHGAAISENRTVQKLMYNSKQNGIVTGYFAGVADS